MKKFIFLSTLALSALMLSSCCAEPSQKQPKYVFYLILDGCGVNTINAQEMYQAELQGRIGRVPTCMTQFPVVGVAST